MPDLAGWLQEQLDRDEELAIAAGSGAWVWEHGYGEMCNDPACSYGSLMQVKTTDPNGLNGLTQLVDVHGLDVHEPWQGAPFIAHFNPARVLADIAAKRKLIAQAQAIKHELNFEDPFYSCPAATQDDDPTGEALLTINDRPGECDCGRDAKTRSWLLLLAEPYSDRPGYQEATGVAE